MTADYSSALAEASRLSGWSDDALLAELGLRKEDFKRQGGAARADEFSAAFATSETEMSFDRLHRIGALWWTKLEPKLLALVCDPQNAEMKEITGNKTVPQIAAGLATAAMAATLAPPAWLIVATTLLAIKIVEAGLDAVCTVWTEDISRRHHAEPEV